RQFQMIDQWKDEILYWIGRIESDLEAFRTHGLRRAFPKNTSSCGNYGGCTYRSVCRFYVDPSALTEPPDGFVESKWDPFDVLHIEKLGLEAENAKLQSSSKGQAVSGETSEAQSSVEN